jgi:hypothetical protein
LGIDYKALAWGAVPRRDPYLRDSEGYTAAEVFVLETGLLIVGLRGRPGRVRYIERPDGSVAAVTDEPDSARVEVNAYVSFSEDVDALLDKVSEVAKSTLDVTLEDYYFHNSEFEGIRREAVTEELPRSAANIKAAKALVDKTSRSLAISVKSSRGLLVRDLGKLVDTEKANGVVEKLVSSGVALLEVVVVCGVTQTQVARVPDKKSLVKLAKDGLRCACGKPIDQESPEDLITITDTGTLLLDKSRWLSVLVKEELISLGVPANDILLECQVGSDEVDCISLVSGVLVIFELKDKEFSMGNAYSFSAKISIINPGHSIIVTTDKVSPDVKDHFNRARRDTRGVPRSAYSGEPAKPIHYVEGDDFTSGIKSIICRIYRADARADLDRALLTGIPRAVSLLDAIEETRDNVGIPESMIDSDSSS